MDVLHQNNDTAPYQLSSEKEAGYRASVVATGIQGQKVNP